MNDLTPEITIEAPEESPLQAAVWMAEDLGVRIPPVPAVFATALSEIVVGSVYATEPDLARLQTREAVAEQIALAGWPKAGLAFGFRPFGGGGRWFYVLVSEQQILVVSVRVSFYTALAAASGRSLISQAHALLETHLTSDVNAAKALASTPTPTRRIVSYANESGLPVETRAIWTAEDGLTAFQPSFEVFATENLLVRGEEALIRV